MDKDSYQRFLRSDIYVALVREVTEAAAAAGSNNNNNNNNESSMSKNISTSESPSQISPSQSFPTLPVEDESTAWREEGRRIKLAVFSIAQGWMVDIRSQEKH